MLRLIFSNSFQALAGSLSQLLKNLYADEGDLQAQSTVVVQSEIMASYVRREMALGTGVCANLTFCSGIHELFESWCLKAVSDEVVWTKNDLFSVLYPYFLKTLDAEIAISRARTHAERLLQLGYVRPDILQRYRAGYLTSGGEYQQLLRSFDRILEASGRRIALPIERLESWRYEEGRLPKSLYIFDPAPFSVFEREWLNLLAQHIEVFVFAFSPCRKDWTEMACRAYGGEVWIEDKAENGGSLQQVEGLNARQERHFLLSRCGRISQKCRHDWQEFVDAPWLELYFPDKDALFHTLNRLQYETLNFEPEAKSERAASELPCGTASELTCASEAECGCFDKEAFAGGATDNIGIEENDGSIVFWGFSSAREEAAWIAEQIAQICAELPDMPLESVAILVPYTEIEVYGPLMRAELMRRGMPHNIHALISQPLEVCYSAFAAFVEFLCGAASRDGVLNWAFHEGIAEDADDFELFAHVVDMLGIYSSLDAASRQISGGSPYLGDSESFTWSDGMARLAAACLHTPETSGCRYLQPFEQGMQLEALKCWQRVRAMLEDHRVVRSQCLGYGQWREWIYGLFDTWLRADVMNREMAMGRLWKLLECEWPSDFDCHAKYSFETIIPLLRDFVRRLENEESGRITGGIQIRPLTCDVFTSEYAFLCGLSQHSFPSQVPACHRYAYAQEEIDAHAWLRWFNNVRSGLYLTAALPDAESMTLESSGKRLIELSHFSVFVSDLAKQLGMKGIELYESSKNRGTQEALYAIRRAWHDEHDKEAVKTQTWPMQISDFEGDIAKAISGVLNRSFWKTSAGNGLKRSDASCESERCSRQAEPLRGKQLSLFDSAGISDTGCKTWASKQLNLFDESRWASVKTGVASGDRSVSSLVAADRVEKSVKWQALVDMIFNPRKAWRKYFLNIRDYGRVSPQMKSRFGVEPIERVDADYAMRKAVASMMHLACASGIDNMEVLTAYYDELMEMFRASGLYPDCVYGTLQRERDWRLIQKYSASIREKLQTFGYIHASPILYRIGHGQTSYGRIEHGMMKRFGVKVVEVASPIFEVSGPDGRPMSLVLTGDLPLFAQGLNQSFLVLSDDYDKSAKKKASLCAGAVVCMMALLGLPLPGDFVAFQNTGELIAPSSQSHTQAMLLPNRQEAESLLSYLCQIFASGRHEILFESLDPANTDNLEAKCVQTPLYRDLGDDQAFDVLSFQHWKTVFESEKFGAFKTLCGL